MCFLITIPAVSMNRSFDWTKQQRGVRNAAAEGYSGWGVGRGRGM